jgi:putative lipoic acid-binding regulatory protein
MDRDAALKLLESHHKFPSDHFFQVIVRFQQADVDGVLLAIAQLVGLPDLDGRVESVFSRKGTYISLRMTLPCQTAEDVLSIYARLQELPQVIRYF